MEISPLQPGSLGSTRRHPCSSPLFYGMSQRQWNQTDFKDYTDIWSQVSGSRNLYPLIISRTPTTFLVWWYSFITPSWFSNPFTLSLRFFPSDLRRDLRSNKVVMIKPRFLRNRLSTSHLFRWNTLFFFKGTRIGIKSFTSGNVWSLTLESEDQNEGYSV